MNIINTLFIPLIDHLCEKWMFWCMVEIVELIAEGNWDELVNFTHWEYKFTIHVFKPFSFIKFDQSIFIFIPIFFSFLHMTPEKSINSWKKYTFFSAHTIKCYRPYLANEYQQEKNFACLRVNLRKRTSTHISS